MKKAYSYARFSSHGQADGTTLDRQLEKAHQYAALHHLDLDTTLIPPDPARSGFKAEHIALGNFKLIFKYIKDKKIKPGDSLLIEEIDRASRLPLSIGQKIIGQLLEKGISIHCVATNEVWHPGDQDSLDKVLVLAVRLDSAHKYSQNLSYRLGHAWKDRRENLSIGKIKKLTARCPTWLNWNKDSGSFDEIKDRVTTVKQIFEMAAKGDGRHKIAKTLNQAAVDSWGGKAKFWSAGRIRSILFNRSVLGEFQPMKEEKKENKKQVEIGDIKVMVDDRKRIAIGELIDDYYPKIIDIGLWSAAHRALKERSTVGRPSKGNHTNLFRGLLKTVDGESISVLRRGKHVYIAPFSCIEGASSDEWLSFPLPCFERAFLQFVSEINLNEISKPETRMDLTSNLNRLIGQMEKKKSWLEKTEKMMENDPSEHLAKMMARFEADIKTLNQEIEKQRSIVNTPVESAHSDIREIKDKIGFGDPELRQRLAVAIGNLVEKIEIKIKMGKNKWEKRLLAIIHFIGGEKRAIIILTRNGKIDMWDRFNGNSIFLPNLLKWVGLPQSHFIRLRKPAPD